MHKVAFRGSAILIIAKYTDLVAHGTPPDPCDPDPDIYPVWKGDRGVKSATRFRNNANNLGASNIQDLTRHKIVIHRRIEIGVINDVVHVSVNIIVLPARRDRVEEAICVSSYPVASVFRAHGLVSHSSAQAEVGAMQRVVGVQ